MTVSLKHLKVSAIADNPAAASAGEVVPSDWNAEHVLTQASARLLGRTTAGTGPTEEITVGSGLTLSGGVLTGTSGDNVTGPALTSGFGDVARIAQFRSLDTNDTRMEIVAWRRNAGSTHETSETRIQRIVDSTRMGFVGFGSDTARRVVLGDSQYGHGGFGEFFRIQSDGLMVSDHTGGGLYLNYVAGQVGLTMEKWHGLAFLTQPSLGGWARGMQVRRSTDNAFIAGIGYLGTDNTVDAIRLGFGSSWWAGNHANPGLSIESTGATSLRGAGNELRLYSRNDGSSYMSWYCPNPGQMFLYNPSNTGNRFEFDNGDIYCRATDALTLWLCPSDNRSLGLHVNSDIAYFMNSTVNGGTSWGTVLDWQSVARYPMTLGLTNGNLNVAGRVTAFSGVTSHYGLEVNNGTGIFYRTTGLTDYTDGCIEVRTGAGDAGIGFHNGGANAGSLIFSRTNNYFMALNNPTSSYQTIGMHHAFLNGGMVYGVNGGVNSYGGVTLRGEKNGYSGLSVQRGDGTYAFTWMCGTDRNYFGLYDETRGVWPLYTATYTSTSKIWYFEGSISASQNVYAYSDARFKRNVKTLSGALDAVARMRGVSYSRTDTPTHGVGVIAQEMQTVEPRVVSETDKGVLTVDYGSLGGYFIEAIKELKARIEYLEALHG
jgi:hypothetical protein